MKPWITMKMQLTFIYEVKKEKIQELLDTFQ